MEDQKSEDNPKKIPSRMARLAWPKAGYGVIFAVIVIIVVNQWMLNYRYYWY